MHHVAQRRMACRLIIALVLAGLACVSFGIVVVVYRDGHLLWDAWQRRSRAVPILWWADALQAATETATAIWFFVLGGCLGSFLNVVVYRLPRGMTLLGSSLCPFCRTMIRTRDNIPVWGWIARGGRCFRCWLPIPVRYPLIELAMAVAILVLAIGEIALQGVTLTGHWERNRLGFSRTLFELDLANGARFLVQATLLFVLVAARLMERDGYRPSIAMLVLAIVLALALFTAVPAASPASWSGDGEVAPQRLEALAHSAWGGLIGLAWGLIAMERWPPPSSLAGSLLLPITIGTALGWRAGLVAMMLAGVLTVFPSIGRHRRETMASLVPAHAYLLACLIVWLGWAAWPGVLRPLFASC